MKPDRRALTGAAGETFAARWLERQGMRVLNRNLRVDGGEIDLLMDDHGLRVAVEVRTIRGDGDPIDAVTIGKRRRVRSIASRLGAVRVDFVAVAIRDEAIEVHWVPG